MAFIDDQQTNFKHFCRICKKGFMCGRALGGHMRAHGIGDESTTIDDDDTSSDWEDRGNILPVNKCMYSLRTNPNKLKCFRVCENCGMEFLSWKSFLEHGKCNSEDAECLKRKSPCPMTDEENLAATCLMMLSNAKVDKVGLDETEESHASIYTYDPPIRDNNVSYIDKAKGVAKGQFECKACKKVFNSHQALGGHRASHKKVKGCFAARVEHDNVITYNDFLSTSKSTSSNFHVGGSSKRKSKVHECTICHRIFSSGQALGGHKRCHWITNYNQSDDPTDQIQYQRPFCEPNDTLDLNFPSTGYDLASVRRGSNKALSFELSTEINLQSWPDGDDHNNKNNVENINIINNENDGNAMKNKNILMQDVDDEADSKVKLAKLSELKDMNLSSGSSSWLQVGISSTTNVGSDA